MRDEQAPALIVIFGVTGDLARRKLLPALYHLIRDNLLHPDTQIIGVTRQKLTKHDVLASLDTYTATHARPSPAALERFKRAFHLFAVDLSDDNSYKALNEHLLHIESKQLASFQRVYYLSVPPSVIDDMIEKMGRAGFAQAANGSKKPRLLIEKPFGYDQKSAQSVVRSVRRHFDESQVFRIDHYLAKEMAQNILYFRFHNPLFASIWNRDHISKVEILAYEKIGIEGRKHFYEQTGALRDLIQSHLLFLASLVGMQRPVRETAHSIRIERQRLLTAIKTPLAFEIDRVTCRGQYMSYRKEVDHARSTTETYAAIRLEVDNEQWQGVPFILRTGKAMAEKLTAIRIHFKTNVLELRLQPDEAIELSVRMKEPGHDRSKTTRSMDFSYRRHYASRPAPEAYENVLLDAIKGDQLLFASSKEILEAWRIVQPILDEWSKSPKTLKRYPNNSSRMPRHLDVI